MITNKYFEGMVFKSLPEYHRHLIDNLDIVMLAKKSEAKHSDGITFVQPSGVEKSNVQASDVLNIKAVINTTNILDSHGDVHMPNIWKQSLKSNKRFLFLQEHEMKFEKVISRNVAAETQMMQWKELGYDKEGETQALIFNVDINEKDNAYMYDLYKRGLVNQHSVGMRYVNLFMCVDSGESWAKEYKENYDKYISEVVNPEDITDGVFYAVTEAKIIEGSAVLMGSNFVTPTLENKSLIEPPKDTQPNQEPIITLYDSMIKRLKI